MKQELDNMISETSEHWAERWLTARIAKLEKTGAKSSGQLKRSFGSRIVRGQDGAAVRIEIGFEEHGRYIDMKRIEHDKWGRNALERLVDWIERKGIERFAPGFLKKYNLKKQPKGIVNNIAWGIMVNRSKGKFRRKKWYAAAKEAGVTELFNEVAANIPDQVIDGFKKSF